MVSISFTCPMASRIVGVQTRKLLSSVNSTAWLVLKPQCLGKPLSNRPYPIMNEISKMSKDFLNMEDMLPSCPSKVTIDGFPSAPRKAPNMANLLPTCPKVAKALGLASKKCMMSGEEVWHMGISLWLKPLAKEEMLIGHCQAIMCSNHRMMKAMVDMMPSCPQKATIPGFPSAPRQEISMGSILSSCPRQSRVPGFPSKDPKSSYSNDLEIVKQLLIEKPLRKTEWLIKGVLKRHFHCPEKRQWFSSVAILPSCPMKTVISGFPSAPQKLTQLCMVNLVQTCPRQTHVSGLPSRICIHSESKGWYAQIKPIIQRPAQKRCTEILQWDLRDVQSTESMAATLPSCPEITSVPGVPSVWRQTLAWSLNMQNIQHTCAKMSTVSGMPFLNHKKTADWSIDTQLHLSPKLRSVLHFEKMYSVDPEMVINMVSMLTSCPREAHLPGFPSGSSSILADVPSMIHLRHICPKNSRCYGIPSKCPTNLDENIWNEDKGLIWERQPGKRKSPKVIYGQRMSPEEKHMVKIMVSMLPPCPKKSFVPGFPSKSQQIKHTSVNKEHQGMFKMLPTFPKHSEIPGLPATNHTAKQDDWQVYRNTIWQKGLGMCPGLQHSWKVKEMPSSDREIMMSMLPPCTRHALTPGFPSTARLLTEYSIPVNQDGPEVMRQKMTSDASFYKGSIVTDLTPALSGPSGDKYSSGNKEAKEILLQPNNQVSFNKKEVALQSGLASGGHKVEKGFWTLYETEDKGTLDEGHLHSRMWHSIPDMPLVLSVRKRCIAWYCSFGLFGKVQVTPDYDVICPLHRNQNMVSILPSCPSAAVALGFPSINIHSEKCPTDRSILWEQLPKPITELNIGEAEEESMRMRKMVDMVPACPVAAKIHGFPSKGAEIDETKAEEQSTPAHFNPPTVGYTHGLTSVEKKTDSSVVDEIKEDMDDIQQACAERTKPPDVCKDIVLQTRPCVFNDRLNMVDILPTFPNISSIPGLSSISQCDYSSWVSISDPLLEKKIKHIHNIMTDISQEDRDHMKKMHLVPTCPRQSKMSGFPSVPDSHLTVSHRANMVSLLPSCPNVSCIQGVPSSQDSLNKTWLTDSTPLFEKQKESNARVIKDVLNKPMKPMLALTPTCPKEASIPGFPSVPKHTVIYHGPNVVDLFPSCPVLSSITGFPSIQTAVCKNWSSNCQPLLEKQIRETPLFVPHRYEVKKEMTEMLSLVPSCPKESQCPGFPAVLLPKKLYFENVPNMVYLSTSCPRVSQIPGLLSSQYTKNQNWVISNEPLWTRTPGDKEFLLTDENKKDWDTMKGMFFLVPSCPNEAHNPGFPSVPNPRIVNCGLHNINQLLSCPHVSNIQGMPSLKRGAKATWVQEPREILLKRSVMKENVILNGSQVKTNNMNMLFIVPSCPKAATLPGFPSIPILKMLHHGLNIVNLLPLCPQYSNICGFPSVEGVSGIEWVAELCSLIKRPLKMHQFMIEKSAVDTDKSSKMFALVPSCSRAPILPGFPSAPWFSMSKLQVCPKESIFPGCATLHGTTKLQWFSAEDESFEFKSLLGNLQRDRIFTTDSPIQDIETLKAMLTLAPSCPETSSIHGFPSAPRSKVEFREVSLVPHCPRASGITGFPSMTEVKCTGWSMESKPLWMKSDSKPLEMIMPLSGQEQPCSFIVTSSMMTMVTSCPKATQVPGLPSAPVENRPPDIVSLYASTPCCSTIPGFPSARMITSSAIDTKDKLHDTKPLLIHLLKKKMYIAEWTSEDKGNMKHLALMAPSCPCVTQIPGFPSILPLESQAGVCSLPTTNDSKPQELCYAHLVQSSPIEASSSDFTLTPMNSPAGEHAFEVKSKESSEQAFVVDGNPQIKKPKAEELDTAKMHLDAPEPDVVLGWEVVEADGTVTDKEIESSLLVKGKENSGLVNTIVGVFSRGYETVASILAPSSSGVAEAVEPKGASSSVDPESNDSIIPYDGFPPLSPDNIALIEKANHEGLSESESKHSIELPTSAEPYMWDLAEDRSASASPTSESDDGSSGLVSSSAMKKWPPLTEADIDEISKAQLEGAEKDRVSFDPWGSKDKSVTEQVLVQTLVEGETGCQAEIGEKVTEDALLDNGQSTGEVSAPAMESTSKEAVVTNNNEEHREMSLILVQPKSTVLSQQDQEHKPDHLGPKHNACHLENAPNDVVKEDALTEIVPTQPTAELVPPRRIKRRTRIPSPHTQKADTQTTETQESIQVVSSQPAVKGNSISSSSCVPPDEVEIQKDKLEHGSVQKQGGPVPPRRFRTRDETIPPETPQKMNDVFPSIPEPPQKKSRKKVPVPITDVQLALDFQASCDPVTSGKPSIPLPSVKATKALSNTESNDGPSQTVAVLHARVQGTKVDYPNDLSGETDVSDNVEHPEMVSSEQKGQTSSQSAENVSSQSDQPADLSSPLKVKIKESDQTKPENEFADFGVEPTECLPIIRKIAPPRSSKKVPTVKSISKTVSEGETCETEKALLQALEVAQIPAAQVAPIPLTQQSDEKDISVSLPIPMPRAKKRLSGSFLDATPTEGVSPGSSVQLSRSCPKEDEVKPRRQRGRRSVTNVCSGQLETSQQNKRSRSLPPLPPADQPAVPAVCPRRSRLKIKSKDELISDDDTETRPSGLPVPKPRMKKRLSGSFPDNFTPAGSSAPSSMDKSNEMLCSEMVLHNTELSSVSLPIPVLRRKKRLSATYPDSTPPPEAVLFTDTKSDGIKRELTSSYNQEATDFSPSLESSTHSKDFVSIPGPEYVPSESNQEANKTQVSSEVELPQLESVGDAALRVSAAENIEDWTFTDKSAETATEAVADQTDVKIVFEAEREKGFASTVTAPQDDWLHLEKMNESEPPDINLGQEVGVEEVGFCLVSVAAGDVDEEW
ncbi:hypothetical protein N1851_003415 [Merluccius polli]|uniref:Uncharacterized protein n=1 Tax=Merluccius polli TaxID=89951 RepID=A0AA47N912_MERPO|nr:hypothetical protein N1851_003415 [Merluccius polli]